MYTLGRSALAIQLLLNTNDDAPHPHASDSLSHTHARMHWPHMLCPAAGALLNPKGWVLVGEQAGWGAVQAWTKMSRYWLGSNAHLDQNKWVLAGEQAGSRLGSQLVDLHCIFCHPDDSAVCWRSWCLLQGLDLQALPSRAWG
jgi:hypothetical protein